MYDTFSCALNSYGASGPAELGLPSWTPSWTAKAHVAAKLGCPGALGCQVGLPRRTWTQFWAPTWPPSAPPGRLRPSILLDSTAL